jgi:hypothetical protein
MTIWNIEVYNILKLHFMYSEISLHTLRRHSSIQDKVYWDYRFPSLTETLSPDQTIPWWPISLCTFNLVSVTYFTYFIHISTITILWDIKYTTSPILKYPNQMLCYESAPTWQVLSHCRDFSMSKYQLVHIKNANFDSLPVLLLLQVSLNVLLSRICALSFPNYIREAGWGVA